MPCTTNWISFGSGLQYFLGLCTSIAMDNNLDKLYGLDVISNSKKRFLNKEVFSQNLGFDYKPSFKEFLARR
jgi:hypothetical protein